MLYPFRLKIVQSLRHFEHLSSALAEAVEMLSTQFNCPTLVMEVVRDISQVPPQELQRDTSGTRAYAAFLTDLAERLPEKVRPCLSLLMQHLDGESSTMRKAVLAILGEIVLRVLNGEQVRANQLQNVMRVRLCEKGTNSRLLFAIIILL